MAATDEYPRSFGPGVADAHAANRLIAWSLAAHITVVAGVGLTSQFWRAVAENREVLTISLGGSPGVRSTGTNSLGGPTVEQAAAPSKRPEPIRPTPPEPPATVTTRTVARQATPQPTPPNQTRATAAARPVAVGPRAMQGSTTVDTGAIGTASGLTFGDDGMGGAVNLDNFCCREYLNTILRIIDSNWWKNRPDRGITTLRFTIRRDGSIDLSNVEVEKSSGNTVLDRAAISALTGASPRMPALPKEYPEQTLIVHLRFPYGQ